MASGLITKQTDLKSLKYGSMPLGSDAPFITKDIGQAPGSQIGAEISHRIDDTSRIAQMLISKPGIKYLLHEAQLQQVNVGDRIRKAQQGGKSLVGAVLQQAGSTLLTTAKLVGSTLAQVPVNGTGTHFVRGFRTDTYLQPTNPGNTNAFASFFGAGGIEGAPYALRGEVIPGEHKTELLTDTRSSNLDYVGGNVFVDRNETANTTLPQGTEERQTKEYAESGTPIKVAPSGSGIRQTTVKPGYKGSISNQLAAISSSLFVKPTGDASIQSGKNETYDETFPLDSTYLVQKQNYITKNNNVTKEKRVRLGDQGAKTTNEDYNTAKRTNSYWFTSDRQKPENGAEVDKINALFPNDGKVTALDKDGKQSTLEGGQTIGRDLIKFRFHILTADGKEKVLYFRAFLDSFADNYTGAWSQVKYLGRAEDFQIYSGFQRKITLSFKIAAATRTEMRPLYEKMIWLASATAPTYATGGQFMRGTITKITVGDYIYELPGVLNSVNYTWNVDYPWEIAMTQPEQLGQDDFEQELPMIMDCSVDFTPIHTFTPTTGLKEYITTKASEATGRRGIPDIDNPNTGIEPVPEVAATDKAAVPAVASQTPLIFRPVEATTEIGPEDQSTVSTGPFILQRSFIPSA
jgi:hypothetical protein